MKGDFLIDGASAYASYGVFILRGGYTGIVSVPAFKPIETTSWLEEDGIEADLSAPVLDKHTAAISFGFKNIDLLTEFYGKLGDAHAHQFSFGDIGRTINLRMTSSGAIGSLIKAGTLVLNFTEDVVSIPQASPYGLGDTRVTQRGFKLDGIDLSQYGCWVLDGSIQNWRRGVPVKENLTVSSRATSGQTYYGQSDAVKHRAKDLTLNLLINARGVSEFNACHNALFYTLTQPGERSLKLGIYSKENGCYYKSSRCNRLEVCQSGTIWCEITLTLTMLNLGLSAIGVLGAENGYYVVTEDGKLIQILLL